MTIRTKLEETLVKHGLWDREAKVVIAKAENEEASLEVMGGRWDDDVSGYPDALFAVLWESVRSLAVEWLQANHPQHFALAILNR